MKLIKAIIRPEKEVEVIQGLEQAGLSAVTKWDVLGRGKQRGLRGAQGNQGPAFLPKALFDLVVEESQAQETIEAIIRANQTGEFGDGKIFVIEMAQAYRISTGEREATIEIESAQATTSPASPDQATTEAMPP